MGRLHLLWRTNICIVKNPNLTNVNAITCVGTNMRLPIWLAATAFALHLLNPCAAQTASPTQPKRWVLADDVRVRAKPSADGNVLGSLPRGAELILKSPDVIDGFCLIEGEGRYGYMACKFLSAERIARLKAGEDGVPPDRRWVSGNGVTLRESPRKDATVLGRMALNHVVTLVEKDVGGGYCKVQPAVGLGGYTACQYLVSTPVVLANVVGSGPASAEYDPERAFALEPSWTALENYANVLRERNASKPAQGIRPRDDVLERMKAHLALGIMGAKPTPYEDWAELKRKAAAADLDSVQEGGRLVSQGKIVPQPLDLRMQQAMWAANELQSGIGIWGSLHDAISSKGGPERVIRLVRTLEFPSVLPSLFKNESELAPPGASAESASGRFGIVFRQLVAPRPKPAASAEETNGAGLYDMLSRTQVLTKPVKRVQLMRDGRLRVESSFLRQSETLWRDVDGPMCEGWVEGFGYGDADPNIWKYFGSEGNPNLKIRNGLKGSLYAFYTNIDLTLAAAIKTEIPMKLDRETTGFVRGVSLYYDLNGDGVPDVVVWEGQGKGPGHLEGPTTTDDRWYRLALANVSGAWKVLGSDIFGYGCGC